MHFNYSKREWRIAIVLFISYVAVSYATMYYLPPSTGLRPAVTLALAAVFFGGLRLWPVVFLAALASAILTGAQPLLVAAIPVSVTIQATLGAYLLRRARLDPLFRRYRDMLILAGTVILIAAILPSALLLVNEIRGLPFTSADWGRYYAASAFCFVILTPLLLRWFAKPGLKRRPVEVIELLVVFGILTAVSTALFIYRIPNVFGVSLLFVMLIPLFWIALRLRPRFVTLSLCMLSIFGLVSVFLHPRDIPLPEQLLGMEMFMIVLAAIFLTITSIEEDRRVNTNLMLSQLATLENAVARISSESRAKNDFIAILAHELRNPLAPVVSAIELLKLKNSNDPEEAETLAMMEGRMGIVRRLLDDLLDISRISEGKLELQHEPVDLQSVINRAVISTEHHRKERHQRLTVKRSESRITLTGDPVRLEQIFSNLLTNASKYSSPGDPIVVTVRERERSAEIEVSDSGVGLEAADIDRIFLPFEQGEDGVRSMKGLGIGLSLVRSFVEMHGGTISVASPGKGLGSSFTVRLPILSSNGPARGFRASVASLMTPADVTGPSILIVDDNDAAAASLGRLLELRGCVVSYAYNGAEAIEQVHTLSPDVVLLDVGLPDIDGYEVAKTLRTQGFTGLVVALSGYSTADAKQRGKEAGFDHYLVKPAGLADLRRVIPKIS